MPQKKSAARRPRLVGVLASLLMVGTSMPAIAFDPNVEAEIRYQIECAILMLTDPDAHVETCNPGQIGSQASLADTNNRVPPPPAPPPAPSPDEDECDEGQEMTDCGCQFPEEEEDECPEGQEMTQCGCQYPPA
jgi:hypothetical protein